jgi:hypothetical protein
VSLQTVFWFVVLAIVLFFFAKSLKQTLMVIGGHAVYEVFNFGFDWVIWPIVQAKGGWMGILCLTAGAFIINLALLWFYQKMGKDWLGVSVLEDMKSRAKSMSLKSDKYGAWYQPIHLLVTSVFKALMWLLRFDVVTFIVFSCHHDSFVATAFLRKGKFGPLTGLDLVIFTMSTIFSCAFWALVSGMFIIPSFTHVWQTITR